MATFHLEIVTPEARVYSDEIDGVVVPGVEGELGALPSHAPLLTTMSPGELQVRKGNEVLSLAVGEGFVEVTGSHVTVLTDMALKVDEIDESKVEAAIARAQEELAKAKLTSDSELGAMEILLQKNIAQLHLKRKKSK